MRIVGPGVWGEPDDRDNALRLLRRLRELDVDFIDTADSYGPGVSESLIHEALHPYAGLVVATKGGMTRQGPSRYAPVGRPEYLRQCVLMSLERLGLEQLDLWYLHRIDPKVPRDEQFDAVREMHDEGLIRNIGLSQVTLNELDAACEVFPISAVQNSFNLSDRSSEPVLNYCSKRGIAFVPFFPRASPALRGERTSLGQLAKQKDTNIGQLALAWLLRRDACIVPIPGTSKVKHLEENVAAAFLSISDEEFRMLDQDACQELDT